MEKKKRVTEYTVADKLVTKELVCTIIANLNLKSDTYVRSRDQIPLVGEVVYKELLHESYIPQIAEIVGQRELSFVRLKKASLRAAKLFIIEHLREEGFLKKPSLSLFKKVTQG